MIAPSSRPVLDEVTLVAVSSVALPATVDALRRSIAQAEFGRVLLLSDRRPDLPLDGIEWFEIERLNSRADYSRFMLHELYRYISTGHALCVQWDGFVVNGAAWRAEFTHYDYIGAVWPHFADAYRVGNGGFSLRSRRLLEICKDIPIDGAEAEDVFIARTQRAYLEWQGIRFAPEALAKEFAYERTFSSGREFGFHGAFNLVKYLSSSQALKVFRSLDPAMLTEGERWEVFRWAVHRGRFRLAATMLRGRAYRTASGLGN